MKLRVSSLLFAMATAVLCGLAHAQAVVVANSGVAAGDVSKAELRDIFTGASTSLKGRIPVTPVLLKAGPANDHFLQLYIGKSDSAFRAGWRSLLFSGQGVMPRTLDSDNAVLEYVARTPRAIGYIGASSPHDGVKILVVK